MNTNSTLAPRANTVGHTSCLPVVNTTNTTLNKKNYKDDPARAGSFAFIPVYTSTPAKSSFMKTFLRKSKFVSLLIASLFLVSNIFATDVTTNTWTSVTPANACAGSTTSYTLIAATANNNSADFGVGKAVVITFPSGFTLSGISGGTVDGTAIGTITKTATTVSFNSPVAVAKNRTFTIVLNGIVNNTTGGQLSMKIDNNTGTGAGNQDFFNASATSQVTINALPTVSTPSSSLCVANTITLSPTTGGTWASSDNSKATVTNAGVVTGVASGSATFTFTQTSTSCSSTTSSVTINPLPTVAAIGGGSSSICIGSTTPAFTDATAGGSWSITNGTGSASITGSGVVTGITAGTVTVNYTTAADGNGCTNKASVSLTVSNLPSISIQPSTSGQTVCQNTSASSFSVTAAAGTGNTISKYEWYSNTTASTSGGSLVATHNSSSTTDSYTPITTASGDLYYYVIVYNNNGCTVTSAVSGKVTVVPSIGNNTIAASQTTVCSGSTPTGFTGSAPTGGTGSYTYLWESSTTNATTGFSAAAGTNNGIDYNPGALTQTTWFRRVVSSGACSNTSTAVVITLTSAHSVVVGAGTEPTCQVIASTPATTYSVSGGSGNYTWSLDNVGQVTTSAGTINSSTGVMTWTNGFFGTVNIIAVGEGCNGANTQASKLVTIAPSVGTPTAITVGSGTEPTCQLTNGTTTTTYATTASNSTSFNWSISNASAGSINAGTGVMTWANGFSGSVDIRVTANGCNGPSSQVSRTVNVSSSAAPSVSIAITSGSNPTCNGTSVTFTATPTNGGATASYQWKKGGVDVGTNSPAYTDPGTSAGSVTVVMTSSLPCATTPTATSNAISLSTTAAVTPSVSIAITSGSNPTCSGSSVTFTATPTNGGTPTYQWKKDGNNVGTNSNTYTDAGTAAGSITVVMTGSLTCVTTPTATSNAITLNVTAKLSPSVSIAVTSGANPTCSGNSVTFTATPTNGGTPVYQWKKDGVNVGANSATYTDAGTTAGAITCDITTSLTCVTSATATSNSINLLVNPLPQGSIAGNTICSGGQPQLTFTATSGTGPFSLFYQAGASSSNNFTQNNVQSGVAFDAQPAGNGNYILKTITDANGCVRSTGITGANATVTTTTSVAPSVSIAITSGANPTCNGTPVTFTATPTNGGTPAYQWKKGGVDIAGETGSTYTDPGTTAGSITVVMTSGLTCVTTPRATSNAIALTVTAKVTPAVSIAITSGVNPTCSGSSVTFTATPTNGGTPTYQWKKDGINVGTNSATYTDPGTTAGDITVVMTSGVTCVTTNTATSNTITLSVTPKVTPSVSIAITSGINPTCSGNSVTFTATPTNGGATPTYQWKKGVTNVGTNSDTYTDAGTGSGSITVVMTSGLSCVTSATATSNAIALTVTPKVTPSVSIAITSGTNPTCSGSSVTFTATATNGGTPTYQWKKDGANVGTNSNTYTDAGTTGGAVTCDITTSLDCVTATTATSNSITLNVTAQVTPSVSIAITSGVNPTCSGSSVTFTATAANGGTPTYQWKKNGTNVGTNSNTYTDAGTTAGSVTCDITTSLTCVTSATATSNSINLVVNPLPQGSLSGNSICSGGQPQLTFTSTSGTDPFSLFYQAGTATSNNFTQNGVQSGVAFNAPSANNDNYILKTVTDANGCVRSSGFTDGSATVTVITITPFNVTGGGAYCAGGSGVAVGLSGSQDGISYQLKKDGVNVGSPVVGTGSAISFGNQTAAGTYTIVATGCNVSMTGNAVVTITPNVTPSVAIAITSGVNPTCSGNSVTFTATPTNGGATPTYQWKKGGVDINGQTAATYTDAGTVAGDITVVMTSSATCVTSATATSNTISLAITPRLTPSVSIAITSGVNPTCSGNSVTFTATPTNGGATPTYQWKKGGVDINGQTAATYTDAGTVAGDITVVMTTSATCVTSATATSNTISLAITPRLTPSVSIAITSGVNPTCSGNSVTFTATPTNGGATPTYQWKKGGVDINGQTAATYTDAGTVAGDITVVMTSSATCVTSATATSNTISLAITPRLTPSVSIAITSGVNPTCSGNSVTFTATPTNGGATPTYQWKKGGVDINGETGSTYTDAGTVAGDITVVMTTSATCVTSATATSNTISLAITPRLTPSVSIAITSGVNPTCSGNSVTFTATPTNGGATPTYQWKKGGVDINGQTAATYTDAGTVAGDITVVMTSSATCVTSATATSNTISLAITPRLTPSVSIAITSGVNPTCSGNSVTFTATPTNGGATPTYQWKKGGVDINGETGSTYTDAGTVAGDITVVMTTSATCVTSATATSNTISLAITPRLTPSVSIAITSGVNPTCSGNSVTFTATPTNGGATPTYQWKKGGVDINGETGSTYTDAGTVAGDITVVMTSSATCVTSATATSNTISLAITPRLTPSVSIAITSGVNPTCSGNSVTFTATPTNGGATPTYQWKKGGVDINGETGSTYTDAGTVAGDITVVMTTSAPCVTSATATSNTISLAITPRLTPSVSIAITSGVNPTCSGNSVTFTATPTNGGATPTYQWKKGGVDINGETGSTYTDAGTVAGDITVVMTTSAPCVTSATATSNTISLAINTQPAFSACPGNQAANTASNSCNAVVNYTATVTGVPTPGITYAFTGATTGSGNGTGSGSTFNKGVTTVTITASNGCSPAATCTFTVTVTDNVNPVVTCPFTTPQTKNANNGVCTYTVVGTEFNATATDNCGYTLSYTLTGATTGTGTSLAGVVFNKGTTTITWTATDAANNTVSCNFDVTVVDNQNPVVTCPFTTPQTKNANNGGCTYTAVGTEFNATATDNCGYTLSYALTGATTGTGTSLGGVVFNKGTTTITWTATDAASNTVSCNFNVTVVDNQNPVVTCPFTTTQTKNADNGGCTYTVVGTEFNATATDNCAVSSLTYTLTGATTGTGTSLAGVVFNKGTTTITWTATDAASNTVSCNFNVTVVDNQNPVVTCPFTTTQTKNADNGGCTYTVVGTEFNATATDNCGYTLSYTLTGATIGTGTSLAGIVFNKGTTTITWTATDGANNSVSCNFNVTVVDNQNPVVTCPFTTTQTKNADNGGCTYTVVGTEFNATATDNCGYTLSYTLTGATTGTGTSLAGVVFNKGTTTITWTATDAANNTVSCNFNVTVVDNQNPVVTCPFTTAQTKNANNGGCTYTVVGTEFNATATDNCGYTLSYALTGATTGTGTSLAGVVFNKGTTTITWTATDAASNTVSCNFNVTVVDNQNPVVTCPFTTAQTKNANNGVCTYTVAGTEFNATATDNCAVSSLTYTLTGATTGTGPSLAGVVFNKGTTTITWTATDAASNTVSCNFNVTVVDNQNPVVTCPFTTTQTKNADNGGCTYTVVGTEFNATATDNCGYTLSYTLTGATIGTGTSLAGIVFNKGTTTITWTATDGANNSVSCNFNVTVVDNQNPVVTCPFTTTQTKNADNGGCTYTVVGTEFNATATDNCGYTLSYTLTGATTGTGTSLAGVVFNKGTTTITWTATDAANNTVSGNFNVTVVDNQNPVVTCPFTTAQTKNANNGGCTYTVVGTEFNATATDNCAVSSLTYTLTGATTGTGTSLAGVVFNKGTTTITWTATDAASNTVSCNFNVTVVDNQNPVVTCPFTTPQTKNANNGGCTYTVVGTEFNATATDNCAVSLLTYTLTGATTGTGPSLAGVVFNKGTTTITWTATDAASNTVSCNFNVTVVDNQNPVVTCPFTTAQTKNANNGGCTYTAVGTEFNATATDNCAVSSLTYALTGATTGTGTSLAGVVFNKGTTTITWTATDAASNTVSCNFNVTVVDNQNPVVTCPFTTAQTKNANNGVCTYTVVGTEFNATATDNCAVSSLTYTLTGATTGTGTSLAGVVFNKGTTTITWTATDAANNSVSCNFNVTVVDNQNPVVTCPFTTPQTKNVNNGVCTYTVVGTEFNATATDNCGYTLSYTLTGATTGTGTSLAGVVFNKGTTTITWTATDAASNNVSCNFNVTVVDNQNPVVTCPFTTAQTKNANNGVCTYTVVGTEFNATATDNCGYTLSYTLTGATTGTGTSLAGVVFNKGTTTITWTATDAASNSVSCNFNVTVVDSQNPVVTCPFTTAQTKNANNGGCTYTVVATEFNATATDNCAVSSLTYALTGATTGTGTSLAGVVFNKGTTTITWTAKDAANNTVSCNFNVTVVDNQNPVVTCPFTTTQNRNVNNGVCTYTVVSTEFNATATDNCSVSSLTYTLTGSTTGTGTSLAGVVFNKGTTTVTWTATDAANNTGSCSFNVLVSDNQAPVITCPASPLMFCYNANGYTIPQLTAADNCGVTSTTFSITGATTRTGSGNDASGAFNPGISTITWTVLDAAGNTSTCSTTVNVNKQLIVTIPDVWGGAVPASAGGVANAIYIGYGPTKLTYKAVIAAAPNNGSAPYSYSWKLISPTTSAVLSTNDSLVVTPSLTAAGNYSYEITVTDGRLCVAKDTIVVQVIDFRDPNQPGNGNNLKLYVCHNGTTLLVDDNAVQAHLAHGDLFGKCPSTGGRVGGPTAIDGYDIKVNVAPNPSTSNFRLYVTSESTGPISIKISDAYGRVKATITGVQNNQEVTFGANYTGGTYFAEVIQGDKHKTVMLIKLN